MKIKKTIQNQDKHNTNTIQTQYKQITQKQQNSLTFRNETTNTKNNAQTVQQNNKQGKPYKHHTTIIQQPLQAIHKPLNIAKTYKQQIQQTIHQVYTTHKTN